MGEIKAQFIRLSIQATEAEQRVAVENLLDTVRQGYEIIATNHTTTTTEYVFRKSAPNPPQGDPHA